MPLADGLVRARTASGLSQDDVAHALGVSRAMVSYWESERRTPNDRQLVALSDLLRVSVGVLLGTEVAAPAPDIASMLLRSVAGNVPAKAMGGLSEFVAFLDTFADLGHHANVPVKGMTESPFARGQGFDSADDARRKAEEVRAHLRLGLGSVGDLDAICEALGVTVYRAELGGDLAQTISGAFLNHSEIGFSLLVNLEMTLGRRRFTIAHELAHALFHSAETRYFVSTATKPPRERFADAFAGEFLMPTESIRRVMEDRRFGTRIDDPSVVIYLHRMFGVSYATALVRLRQAKLLSGPDFDSFKRLHPLALARSLGYEIGEEELQPRSDMWRLERFPQQFRRLLRSAVQRDIISVSTAAGLTHLSIDEVVDLVNAGTETSDDGSDVMAELHEFEESGVVPAA